MICITIKTQVLTMLNAVTLGKHYFKTGLLYRETNVINKLLCNSEAWYGLKETEIDALVNSSSGCEEAPQWINRENRFGNVLVLVSGKVKLHQKNVCCLCHY